MSVKYTAASRTADDVSLIVMHCTDGEGDADSVVSWWAQAGVDASYHYLIDRDGKVNELVNPRHIAWHAGNWSINRRSIGVSLVGRASGFRATEEQRSALIRLLARLSFEFELSLMRIVAYDSGRYDPGFGVMQHANVPGANHTDVAPQFPLRELCARARDNRNKRFGALKVELR